MLASIPYRLAPEAYAYQLFSVGVTIPEFIKAYRDAKKRGTGPLSHYEPEEVLEVIEQWPKAN